MELLDVIGPLTDPVAHGGQAADAFHAVIPSMPGFGFSGPAGEAGWDSYRIATAFAELMSRLGYGSPDLRTGQRSLPTAVTYLVLDYSDRDSIVLAWSPYRCPRPAGGTS